MDPSYFKVEILDTYKCSQNLVGGGQEDLHHTNDKPRKMAGLQSPPYGSGVQWPTSWDFFLMRLQLWVAAFNIFALYFFFFVPWVIGKV